MRKLNSTKITILICLSALSTLMCTTTYITPSILTQTAAAYVEDTPVPTAHFVIPTDTVTPSPFPTETLDPMVMTLTPQIASPTFLPSLTPTNEPIGPETPPLIYYAQAGDTLKGLANRFGVSSLEIVSAQDIPEENFIHPNQMLMIPVRLALTSYSEKLFPDSDVVFSPTAADFDIDAFIESKGGYLSTYSEYVFPDGIETGAEVIEQVAYNHSINPRLLISLLDYNSHWVTGKPLSFADQYYPMRLISVDDRDLQSQLSWAARQISIGYYGWRDGSITQLQFPDGSTLRLAPTLNAGTVGVMYYFSKTMNQQEWEAATHPDIGAAAQHEILFEDPWARAAQIDSLFPPGLIQPPMILPFSINQIWAYTGGPHGAWSVEGAQAAIDFAPGSTKHGCAPSDLWVVAAAPGVIARTGEGFLILDLDGDGIEQTGWSFFYLHLDSLSNMVPGKWVDKGDKLGHPSCLGGRSTGTHIHIARKYNGEWIAADGPIPFTLSGWQAIAGDEPYEGSLYNGEEIIEADPVGGFASNIKRTSDDP